MLKQTNKPVNHIAIIMDGNGRWAKKYKLPKIAGHAKGRKVLKKIIARCVEINLETLTIFAFSSENINRPKKEVDGLFTLFLQTLKTEVKSLKRHNIQLQLIGDLSIFPQPIQQEAKKALDTLAHCTGMVLSVAVNYGGQWDINQAVQKIAKQVELGNLSSKDINQHTIKNYLSLAKQSEVDLLIRTSGELRISNFLLWDIAYAEFAFTNTLWPDFQVDEFDQILENFHNRDRRFGQ